MSFTARAIVVGEYVLLQHEGKLALQDLEDGRTKAIQLLEANRWRKLLVDLRRATIDIRTVDLFYFTASHLEKFPRNMQIAVLGNPKDHDKTSFADTVACNRGVIMQTYDNWDQATEWITRQHR